MTSKIQNPFAADFVLPTDLSPGATEAPGKKPLSFGGVSLPHHTVYLDYAAATPVHLKVWEAMTPYMLSYFGNPANRLHPMGELALHALSLARHDLAGCLGVEFDEVTFTASATESNNLLLRGLVAHPLRKRTQIVYAATEHSSIVSTALRLAEIYGPTHGIEAISLPVDTQGQIDVAMAQSLINQQTLCVCVMDINNETGIIQSTLQQIINIAHAADAPVHIDAVQGFARSDFHAGSLNFDSAVISSAKIYGPKGASALIIRKRKPRRLRLEPQITGGGQEEGLRSGTSNLPAIVGFALAAKLQVQERAHRLQWLTTLETTFLDALRRQIDVHVVGLNTRRAPGILMIRFEGVNAMKLVEVCKTLCVSVGSACRTLQATASHVLVGMGIELDDALASVRVSFGIPNSLEEATQAALILAQAAHQLRGESATLK